MKPSFFQPIVELYKNSAADKQRNVVVQLAKYGNPEGFLEYLNSRIGQKNFQSQIIFSLAIEYCLEARTTFKQETLNGYVDFFIKMLEQYPTPSSFTKFSEFLVAVFANVDSYNTDKMFNILKDLPNDISILPLAHFSVQNKQYMQYVFDKAITMDTTLDNPSVLLWCQSISILFNNGKDSITYDNEKVYQCIENSLKNMNIPLSLKFMVFNACLNFLNRETCNKMINSYFKNLCLEINSSSKGGDFAEALIAASNVMKHIKAEKVIDPSVVYDTLFNQILIYYRPLDIIDNALAVACKSIDTESLKFLLNPFVAANVNPNCAYFIISHFPADEYLPYLLGVDTDLSITVWQYKQILYYLENFSVPSTYIPHLFKLVTVTDMPVLDAILDRSPHMYCTAAAKYLATSDDKAKIEYIASALSKRQVLPFIRSRQLPTAFVNVAIQTLQGEAATMPFAVMMEYLYACCSCVEEESEENDRVMITNKFARSPQKVHHEYEEDANEHNISEDMPASPVAQNPTENTTEEQQNEPKPAEEAAENENKPNETENKPENTENENNLPKSEENAEKHPKTDSPKRSSKSMQLRKDFSTAVLFKLGDEAAADFPTDFFDVSHVKCDATSPAMLVYNIVQRSQDFCTTLTNMVLDGIREGKSANCIMIAAISGDQQLLNQCVQVLSQTPSMLVHFFTVCCCVSPRIAAEEMVRYFTKVEKVQSFFTKKTVSSVDEIKLETVLHSLISMAPFIKITPQIVDLLRMVFEQSRGSFLSFEAIAAICRNAQEKYDVDMLLTTMAKEKNKCDSKTFIDALTSVIQIAVSISPENAELVSEVWVKNMTNGDIKPDKNCQFEKAFLNEKFSDVTLVPYLTHLERAFIKQEDCVALYRSLSRIIEMKTVDLKFLQRYITLCISNCLSTNIEIRNFCVETLKTWQGLENTISPDVQPSFTTDTIDATRPFFDELSSKFAPQTRLLLAEAVMKHFMECKAENRVAILIFLDCLITLDKNVDVYMKKGNFVHNLLQMTTLFDFKSPLASMHCNILYTLACTCPSAFFDQILEFSNDSVYVRHFLGRYYGETSFAKAFSHFIYFKVEDCVNKQDESVMPKLLRYLDRNISKQIFMYTEPDEIAVFLYTLFLIISDLYDARRKNRKSPSEVQEMLEVLYSVTQRFQENTTVSLQRQQFDFSSEDRFSNCLSDFVREFSRLPNIAVSLFVQKVFKLSNNATHSSSGGIVFAYLLASYSQAYSQESRRLLAEYLSMFFAFLKDGKATDPRIVSSLMSAIILFTPSSFKTLDFTQIQRLLNVTLETAKSCPQKALKVINLIVSAADKKVIETQLGSIVGTIRVLIQSGTDEKECFALLRAVLEVRREAEWFIKDGAVSLGRMTQIVVSQRNEDVEMILAKLMSCEEFDHQAIFTTMMGLFAAVELSHSHYAKICEQVLAKLEPAKANEHQVRLVTSICIPLCSVGDGSGDLALDKFGNFLVTAMEKNQDQSVLSAAMEGFAKLSTMRRPQKQQH